MRIRDLGYSPGKLPTGPKNSILDIKGVSVGQVTLRQPPDVNTGVTVILPRPESDIQTPCYAGVHALNGAGELTGSFQIKEWGWTNTPLAMTNSVALGKVYDAIWHWSFRRARAAGQSTSDLISNYGAPVIGETCDWALNDLTLDSVQQDHVYQAFENAKSQTEVLEGSHGGGTGMLCSQFKGGTGTASRVVPGDARAGDYTVGVANITHQLQIHILTSPGNSPNQPRLETRPPNRRCPHRRPPPERTRTTTILNSQRRPRRQYPSLHHHRRPLTTPSTTTSRSTRHRRRQPSNTSRRRTQSIRRYLPRSLDRQYPDSEPLWDRAQVVWSSSIERCTSCARSVD